MPACPLTLTLIGQRLRIGLNWEDALVHWSKLGSFHSMTRTSLLFWVISIARISVSIPA